jgi:RNA polymerase sigma-32 factor
MFISDLDDSNLSQWRTTIERYAELDRDAELELARRYRAGDKRAGDRLVCASLRYVPAIARRYRGYGLRMADLVGEGNVGLLQALRRFDPERGLRFMTYASHWVRAQILSYVLKHWSVVSIGTGPVQSKLFFRLYRETSRIEAEIGDAGEGTRGLVAQLAERFNCSEEKIRAMQQRMTGRDVSLEAPAHREGTVALVETIPDAVEDVEAHTTALELRETIRARVDEAMATLDDRERRIVEERLFGDDVDDGPSLHTLGRSLGISRERVRQLERRIKGKLRRSLADIGESEFVGAYA